MKVVGCLRLLMLAALSLCACAEQNAWYGEYVYEAHLGENSAEDAVIVEYRFRLDKHSCAIELEGYQVSEAIICTAQNTPEGLKVSFSAFGDGTIKNKYDVAVYPVGGMLFTLSREGKQIVTTWGELLPDESLAIRGKYFSRR